MTLEQSKLAFANNYDFDCPDSLDFDLLVETIGNLKKEVKLLSQFIRSLHIIVLQKLIPFMAPMLLLWKVYMLYMINDYWI